MELVDYLILGLAYLCAALGAVYLYVRIALVRNDLAYKHRSKNIDEAGLENGQYDALPSHKDMVFKHWNKWTYKQWMKWVEKRKGKA